ncbi:MAG: hypothetical protein KDA28_06940, partial [Phycisphaerales bacterium]|nr:hypothetical protein [Phycisphaerales bacterium]
MTRSLLKRGIIIALVLGRVACAQETPPDAASSQAAFDAVERSVRSLGEVPIGDVCEPSVCTVHLRLRGRLIGRGAALGEGAIARATASAIEAALTDLRATHDALFEERIATEADLITISLTLGGTLVPLGVDEVLNTDLFLSPGMQGLAARIGERFAAAAPEYMLTSGLAPSQVLATLTARLRGDATLALSSPSDLVTSQGVIFYRFRVSHLAQPAPGQGALFLTRGDLLEPQLTSAAMRTFADGMAAHLLPLEWPGPEPYGLRGALDPVSGTYAGVASPLQQAMVVVALRRYAALPGAAHQAEATRLANRLLTNLVDVESIEDDPASEIASAAACVIAATEGGVHARLRDHCAPRVLASYRAGFGFEDVPVPVRSLVALALVRLDAPTADRAIRDVFRGSQAGNLVANMPWLLMAEREHAGSDPLPSSVALREMRDRMWTFQLTGADVQNDAPDLMGGIVFTTGGAAF